MTPSCGSEFHHLIKHCVPPSICAKSLVKQFQTPGRTGLPVSECQLQEEQRKAKNMPFHCGLPTGSRCWARSALGLDSAGLFLWSNFSMAWKASPLSFCSSSCCFRQKAGVFQCPPPCQPAVLFGRCFCMRHFKSHLSLPDAIFNIFIACKGCYCGREMECVS